MSNSVRDSFNAFPSAAHLHGIQVQLQISYRVGRCYSALTPHHGVQAGNQLGQLKRFYQIVVSAGIKTDQLVIKLVPCGQHQHRSSELQVLAQPAAHLHAVHVELGEKHTEESADQVMHRFGRMGTIDLRVDFLRPGLGQHFIGRAEVTRLGGRIGSTQMRMENEQGTLIATASAAFVVS